MNTRHVPSVRQLLAPLVLATLAITAACGSDDGDSSNGDSSEGGGGGGVAVSAVWVREPAEGATATAAYGVITNETDGTVTLVGASTPVTDDVEIHETLMSDDGAMSMQQREDGFAIDAGDSFTLEPGGPHVMLLDVDAADITDPVEITFEFDGAAAVSTSATVESVTDGMDDMDHEDMDHEDMDMDDGEMDDMDDGEMDEGDADMEDMGS